MKKINVFLLLIAGVFCFIAAAYASGESYSIAVSCAIPAVPGVNAPAEEGNLSKIDTQKIQLAAGEEVNFLQEEQKIISHDAVVLLTSIYAR